MTNQYHSDALATPIMEYVNLGRLIITTSDLEAATKTITATAEAAGTANADYHYHATMATPVTDPRFTLINMISYLTLTIDSDAGVHDLRCRVYIDSQDADHMLFDVSCTTTGAQYAVQPLNATTLAIIFNLFKDGAAHTLYYFLWSPANQSPVISALLHYTSCGSNAQGDHGIPVLSFTTPVNCEMQVRQMSSCGPTGITGASYALVSQLSSYYWGSFLLLDTGAVYVASTAGANLAAGWTWQIIPAGTTINFQARSSAASGYCFQSAFIFYIKRWN